MAATIELGFRFGGDARRREEGGTARLLVIGDFGARAHRGIQDVASLRKRPVHRVDVDVLDAAIARCAPRLRAELGDGTAVELPVAGLDDFHPDRLVALHPALAALTALRARLADPRRFEDAAAEWNAISRTPAITAAPSPATAPPEGDRATLDRLLGEAPARGAARTTAARTVDALVRKIGGAPAPTDRDLALQSQYLAALDALATARLRALMHSPAFRSLEAAWRGVHLLVSRVELGEELELYLLDATLEELRVDAVAAAEDPTRSALAARLRGLVDAAAESGASWTMAAGLFGFGATDLDVLSAIGAAARAVAIPFVAGADPTIAGTCPEPSEWRPPETATLERWRRLRASAGAPAIALLAPRFLLRLPYGRATDPIDSFAFEEMARSTPESSELLWGESALAATLARALEVLDIDDLPALTYEVEGESALRCCAEWPIGESAAERLIDHGIVPLLGSRHRNAVRLAGWRSIART